MHIAQAEQAPRQDLILIGLEIMMPCPVYIFVTIICLSEDCGRQKPHETSCNKQLIEAGLI